MTDDFQLFGDPDDGERPIDPDVALVSAYLAHELSPMQVLAIEERLATDAAFRSAMQPLLDAWAAPVASLGGGASRRAPALSEKEREASWRRFAGDATPIGSIRQVPPRRTSMKRAAAVIALVVVPMASFAQVVVYAANNPEARGHTIAKRIVAPFVRQASAPTPGAQLPGGTSATPGVPRAREVDTGSLLPVPVAPVFPLESESASRKAPRSATNALPTTGATSIQGLTTTPQAQVRQPNRAQVAALAREHEPNVVNGSARAEYVVMVVDAAERYVWSTSGSGNVMTEVAGDTRTVAERNAYVRDNRAEFYGDTLAVTGFGLGGTATGIAGGAARGGGRGGGSIARARIDSGSAAGRVSGFEITVDSARQAVRRLQATDSARVRVRAGGGGAGVSGSSGVDTARARVVEGVAVAGARGGGGGGGRAIVEGFGTVTSSSPPFTYKHGYLSTRNAPAVNDAPGLVPVEDGWSGIEGLPSASVAGAETYHFKAGELAPTLVRVILVRLTPDAVWSPR